MRRFQDASLRGVTAVQSETGEMGISFELDGGDVARLCLDWQSSQALSELIADFWAVHRQRVGNGAASDSGLSSGTVIEDFQNV